MVFAVLQLIIGYYEYLTTGDSKRLKKTWSNIRRGFVVIVTLGKVILPDVK